MLWGLPLASASVNPKGSWALVREPSPGLLILVLSRTQTAPHPQASGCPLGRFHTQPRGWGCVSRTTATQPSAAQSPVVHQVSPSLARAHRGRYLSPWALPDTHALALLALDTGCPGQKASLWSTPHPRSSSVPRAASAFPEASHPWTVRAGCGQAADPFWGLGQAEGSACRLQQGLGDPSKRGGFAT